MRIARSFVDQTQVTVSQLPNLTFLRVAIELHPAGLESCCWMLGLDGQTTPQHPLSWRFGNEVEYAGDCRGGRWNGDQHVRLCESKTAKQVR